MAESALFKVSTGGGVINGFETADVVDSFSTLLDMPVEKASEYIDQKKLIRKNLSQQDANNYQEQLQLIGVPVLIEEVAVVATAESSGLVSSHCDRANDER